MDCRNCHGMINPLRSHNRRCQRQLCCARYIRNGQHSSDDYRHDHIADIPVYHDMAVISASGL